MNGGSSTSMSLIETNDLYFIQILLQSVCHSFQHSKCIFLTLYLYSRCIMLVFEYYYACSTDIPAAWRQKWSSKYLYHLILHVFAEN